MSERAEPARAETAEAGTSPEVTEAVEAAGGEGAVTDPRDLARTSRQAVWGWRSNLDQLMPVVLFLLFFNLDALRLAWLNNIEIAIFAATAWSVKAAFSRRRRGLPIGAWLPVITGYLLVRAAVAISVERDLVVFGVSTEAVYFGWAPRARMAVNAS